MARIRPFRALRWTAKAGSLHDRTSPALETLTENDRQKFAEKEPNIVQVSMPEPSPDDRSKYIRYSRSSAMLSYWRREGLLVPDPNPGLYVVDQSILVALVRIEDIARNSTPVAKSRKDDRLRLLEATRTHIEFPLAVVDGIDSWIEDPAAQPISDEAAVERTCHAMAGSIVTLLSGEALYEAALEFQTQARTSTDERPEDYIPVFLCSPSAKGVTQDSPLSAYAKLQSSMANETNALLDERNGLLRAYYSSKAESGLMLWSLKDF